MGDGTGNSSAKVQKTNVWRIYQALDLSKEKQIARYDNGVGTPSNRYLALAGGTFGWGLKRNVLDIHMFVFAIWFANFVSRFDVSLYRSAQRPTGRNSDQPASTIKGDTP
jgi:T6SS, Phospholipase effector Tle1-like, catalytic domain